MYSFSSNLVLTRTKSVFHSQLKLGPSACRKRMSAARAARASAASRASGDTCEGRAKISRSIALTSVLPPGAMASKATGGTDRCAGSTMTRSAAKANPCAAAGNQVRFHVDRYSTRARMQLVLINRIRRAG